MKIDIRYTMTAPLSHIGETASTGAYFNMVRTASGRLPVVTGNSIRGQIRDAGAGELLEGRLHGGYLLVTVVCSAVLLIAAYIAFRNKDLNAA